MGEKHMISRQRKKSIRSGQKMMVYIVVTALILFYGIFVFFPMIYALVGSFCYFFGDCNHPQVFPGDGHSSHDLFFFPKAEGILQDGFFSSYCNFNGCSFLCMEMVF